MELYQYNIWEFCLSVINYWFNPIYQLIYFLGNNSTIFAVNYNWEFTIKFHSNNQKVAELFI